MTVVVALGGEVVAADELAFTAGTRFDTEIVVEGTAPITDDIEALDDNVLTAMESFVGAEEDIKLGLLAAAVVTGAVIVKTVSPVTVLPMADRERAEVMDPGRLVLSSPLFCNVVEESRLPKVIA